ncbi:MAG: DnaJ domain-containing protein [bacterium]|nr:DnaJ domain-containing protein [bacterium]
MYLERGTGVVDVERSGGRERFYFRQGEVFLPPNHPAAASFSRFLGSGAADSQAVLELQHAVATLAREWSLDREATARFQEDEWEPSGLVGPLPTVSLVMELAVQGCDEADLIARLGGARVRFQSSDQTPALEQLPGLEPEMAEVLAGLAQPATLGELLRGAGSQRAAWLRGLSRLRAVGLVTRVDSADAEGPEELLTPKLLQHFTDHVAEDLADNPLALPIEEHRNRLAELLRDLGKMNYYELLGIEPEANNDEVLAAYNRLARVVHTSHAPRLGLRGMEEGIRVVFERVTEAYLVLSDPRRRSSYNMLTGIQHAVEIDQVKRDEEKRQLARQNYRRAVSCMAQMDYSQAVDMLKEAVRLDPQPEYFARLGRALAKNPNWWEQAVGSYRRAVELSPSDAGIRAGYAEILEDMGERDEARKQYKAALETMPDHVGAREALERLGKR